MVPFIGGTSCSQIYPDRKGNSGFEGLGRGENGKVVFNGSFQDGMMKKFRKWLHKSVSVLIATGLKNGYDG